MKSNNDLLASRTSLLNEPTREEMIMVEFTSGPPSEVAGALSHGRSTVERDPTGRLYTVVWRTLAR
jgi:hypothetical protein